MQWLGWKRYDKVRPLTKIAVGDDGATMPLHDFATNRQSHSATLKLIVTNQTLEGLEYALHLALIEANAIILNLDLNCIGCDALAANMYLGWNPWSVVFQSTSN